jgi:hypothetical protein
LNEVVTALVEGMKSYKPPAEIIASLVKAGLTAEAAEMQMRAVGTLFGLVSAGKAASPLEAKTGLLEAGVTETAATTALTVLEELAKSPDGLANQVSVEDVVGTILEGLDEQESPEQIANRLVALAIPPDLASLQVNVLGQAIQLAVKPGAEQELEKLFLSLEQKGIPEAVLQVTAMVLSKASEEREPPEDDGPKLILPS